MESPHTAQCMFTVMLKCIQKWNIEDKLFSVTLDNAAVNTSMIEMLKGNLLRKRFLPCKGKLFHVHCAAHVINIIVQVGMKKLGATVQKIREGVKYIKGSQSRKEHFEDIIVQVGVSCERWPCHDVTTRWNYTYLMLDCALEFKAAFVQLKLQDINFKYNPSDEEWKTAEDVCRFLKVFYDSTNVVSGTKYPTSNRYFDEIWAIKSTLDQDYSKEDAGIVRMVEVMKRKFQDYWNISYLTLSVPVIVDPRFKYSYVKFRLEQAFGDEANDKLSEVKKAIEELFSDYSPKMNDQNNELTGGRSDAEAGIFQENGRHADWDKFLSEQVKTNAPNELESYYKEDILPRVDDFDILTWWKANSLKYPVLSRIARDVLAIPASTVPSENAFSTGGRVISDYRSRLKPEIVEALICLQDWMRVDCPSLEMVLSQEEDA